MLPKEAVVFQVVGSRMKTLVHAPLEYACDFALYLEFL